MIILAKARNSPSGRPGYGALWGVPALEEFTEREAALLAGLAPAIQTRIETVADRCVFLLADRLPQHRPEWTRADLLEAVTEFLRGFFAQLASGDPDATLGFTEAFVNRIANDYLKQPRFDLSPLSRIFAATHVLDVVISEEIDRRFADNDSQRAATHLACAHLWTKVSETLASAFSQLREDYLRGRYERAQEASRLKSESVANMTHEIRTPLNVILGYADLMMERLTELNDPTGIRFADPVRRAGQRLLSTISAILDLSRIEAGAYELKVVPIKVAAMVEHQVSDLSVLAMNKQIGLSCVIEEPDAIVLFDEHCLSAAVINLLQNAIKFTESGTVSVRLSRDESGALTLAISDTGIGMDPAYQRRLFEPFSREAPEGSRPSEGSGLGLALVKRYLELNGARIEVESQKNVGSVFTIIFAEAERGASD